PSDPVLVDDLLTVPVSASNLQAPEKQRLPFDAASDHDLPTVASSAPNLQVAEKQQQPPLPKRRPAPRSRIVSIISGLIVLLVLVILASTVYLYNNHQASVNAIAHSQTATAVVRPTQIPTHAPTV